MVSVQARQEQVTLAIQKGLSQRRACALLKISRSSLSYSHKLPLKDTPVIEAMKILSGTYPRFGSRRIKIFLQRDGHQIGKERCGRLWSKAGLQVPKKRRRKRAGTTLRPLATAVPNSVWCYDFVHDAGANGQKIKCLTVVDEFTRV
jgi:putative transposase